MSRTSRCSIPPILFALGAGIMISLAAEGIPAQPGTARVPTDAEIATSPAVVRLKELLEVVNRGDAVAMKAYIQANGVDVMKQPPGAAGLPLLGSVLDLHRRSLGLDLRHVATLEDSGVVAVVGNRLTGDEEVISLRIEPQIPHRITGIPNVPLSAAHGLIQPRSLVARSEKAQLAEIASYLKRLGDADVFSGVVVIARDGKSVFSHAYGYADREKKIANTVDTRINLASVNKLFTGLAIGQLVEQGKLSYEDPLSNFIPNFPDAESARRIKIKHLLSHTSGLGNFGPQNFSASLNGVRSVQGLLAKATKVPLSFEPGTKWNYSNLGFHILGRIIEIVTGEDYYEYMDKNIFAPAGMTNTSFPDFDRPSPAIAQPYEIEFNGERLYYANKSANLPPRGGPSGRAVASAPDLIKLTNALHAGRIVKPETLRLHAAPKPELASPSYGYGFFTDPRGTKRPFVGHPGNIVGGCAEYGVLTDTPYTIVVLSNATIRTCVSVTGKILQVLTPTKTFSAGRDRAFTKMPGVRRGWGAAR